MASERKILVAIDASEQAEHAFNWYLTTVHKPDNQVVCVHVPEVVDADRSRHLLTKGMLYLSPSAWEDSVKKEHDKVKALEDKFNGKILENGISGKIRAEPGNKPGEVIVKVAEEEKATMIVMGTRGLGKVRRTIMGSVSDYVVHHAHCPVVVCRQ